MSETPTQVVLLECNIDDMTGEALGFALERLFQADALDAWFTAIQMKKSRPATLLSVLCRTEQAEAMIHTILRETTTLGVRRRMIERTIAEREITIADTPWGPVRVKTKYIEGERISCKPEFEDCAALARESGVSLQIIQQAALNKASQPDD